MFVKKNTWRDRVEKMSRIIEEKLETQRGGINESRKP